MKRHISFYKSSQTFFTKVVLLYSLIALSGCNDATMSGIKAIGANITPIEKISREQTEQVFYVEGQVEKIVPLLEGKRLYKLNDSSGTIWVLANQANFKLGEKVVFQGKLKYKDIPLAESNFGSIYLEEKS